MKSKLTVLALMLGAAGLMAPAAQAQDKVKIGFITDMSSLYADVEGKNGAVAIQMAIDDFGGKVMGMPIELLTADHQNKADIAASKAREWIDTQGLTMLFGGTQSGTALASAKIAAEKKRVYVNSGAGSSALTNEQCTPYTVHYAYDTVALARGTGSAVVDSGGKSWFFLTADYAFGQALKPTPPLPSRPRAAPWWARCATLSMHPISLRSCCRHKTPKRKFWAWPTPVATPSTPSRQPRNLVSTRP